MQLLRTKQDTHQTQCSRLFENFSLVLYSVIIICIFTHIHIYIYILINVDHNALLVFREERGANWCTHDSTILSQFLFSLTKDWMIFYQHLWSSRWQTVTWLTHDLTDKDWTSGPHQAAYSVLNNGVALMLSYLCHLWRRAVFPCWVRHHLWPYWSCFFFLYFNLNLVLYYYACLNYINFDVCILNFCEGCCLLPLGKALLCNRLMYIPMGWWSVTIKAETNSLSWLSESSK